jgi:hypothetical protein
MLDTTSLICSSYALPAREITLLNAFRRLYRKLLDTLQRVRFGRKPKSKGRPKDHPDIYPLW